MMELSTLVPFRELLVRIAYAYGYSLNVTV